ncbi:MAG: tRNA pseudouridine(55) synthase TruB [Oscillochloridaceae bacterium]|nr:tRNA pseudouridine(55) synthase TruB [Chloroflexaceae bacterium]MDW8391044.1 tRNA pseudouridine(55) synthase TruB [Oscillochloridaceae bacterium]
MTLHGFLNINKPAGLTSHDVVARVRRIAGHSARVGHAGTLDPMATGVLPVALGHATRLIEYLTDARKGYVGLVRLGVTTTTDDAAGEVLATRPVPPLDDAAIEAAIASLRGDILQIPPAYAALHYQGRRLYDLARAGAAPELPPRPVVIYRFDWERAGPDTLRIVVECGKGAYIRSLARDIGAALGCGAHLAALRRTFVGPFHLDTALALDILSADPANLVAALLPPETAVAGWPAVTLDAGQARRVANGLPVDLPALDGEWARAHGPDGALLAVLRRSGDHWRPEKVFFP